MSCAPCAAAASGQNAINFSPTVPTAKILVNNGCGLDKDILTTWQKMLQCVKKNQKQENINLYISQINQLLGVIQSALNFPDNYCYYYEQLEYFKDNVLPLIVNNVPDCLN